MNSALKHNPMANPQENYSNTRLALARKAIEMLYEKLNDDDVFCLITFHN
jgi:hypothetical protein